MRNFFKITAVFAFAAVAVSCTTDRQDGEIESVDPVAIDSVKIINDTMSVFAVQTIRTYSTYASGCRGFYGYDYQKDDLNRKVTAYSYTVNGTCTQAAHTQASQFAFRPEQPGIYTFNFAKGNNQFITETIVVE